MKKEKELKYYVQIGAKYKNGRIAAAKNYLKDEFVDMLLGSEAELEANSKKYYTEMTIALNNIRWYDYIYDKDKRREEYYNALKKLKVSNIHQTFIEAARKRILSAIKLQVDDDLEQSTKNNK